MKKFKEVDLKKLLLSKNPLSTTIHIKMSEDVIPH